MKRKQNNKSEDQNTEKLKEIPKWTRKYAQNRTLPNLIGLLIYLCLFAGIAIPSYFGGKAYHAGNTILFRIYNSTTIVAMMFLFYFCVPKLGGKFIKRISQRVCGQQGDVSISQPKTTNKRRWVEGAVALVFGLCVISSVYFGGKYNIQIKYMLPISALYIVPFMAFLYFWQRPKIGPLALLWPALYAIHAILIVAGVPILFTRELIPLNMILPVFGYGFLTYIIGHIYSRYALKKLKEAAHLGENATDGA